MSNKARGVTIILKCLVAIGIFLWGIKNGSNYTNQWGNLAYVVFWLILGILLLFMRKK